MIKAFELAPKGIVTDIYPKQENEGAFGLDMLQEHERKRMQLWQGRAENIRLEDHTS